MKVRLLFAWYDLWVGCYWHRSTRELFVLPLPCVGLVISFGENITPIHHAACGTLYRGCSPSCQFEEQCEKKWPSSEKDSDDE